MINCETGILKIPGGARSILYMEIYLSIFVFLLEMLGMSHSIEYLFDFFTVLLLVYLLARHKKIICGVWLPAFQIIFLAFGALVSVINGTNIGLIIWSLRNYGRFIIFFTACVLYLSIEDYNKFIKILSYLVGINFIAVVMQRYVFNLSSQDWIGGIFGSSNGANGNLNVFMVCTTSIFVIQWMKKRKDLWKLVLVLIFHFFEAAIAELKFFFIEAVLIFILVLSIEMIVNKNYKLLLRSILFAVFACFIMSIFLQILYIQYPVFKDFFSIEKIFEVSSGQNGYTNTGDVNRLTFISKLNDSVLNHFFIERVTGMGLGAAEFISEGNILSSEIYRQFKSLNYHYFSLSFVYLEIGYIGLALYVGSFVITSLYGIRQIINLRNSPDQQLLAYIGTIVCLMSIPILIYDSTMRNVRAYMMYFFISMIYVTDLHR